MPRKDLTGQRFGRLTVIRATEQRRSGGGVVYECLCDCGNTCFTYTSRLTAKGSTRKRSCGCLQKEMHFGYLHGGCDTPLHKKWIDMKQRCCNPKRKDYHRYGGRGICVCSEWQDDFEVFRDWALSNGYKEGLTLDRIDVDGNYCPENCRWATAKEQANNRETNVYIEYNGETHTIAEWAAITGLTYSTLNSRFQHGWPPERALTEPTRKNSRQEVKPQ